jgi:hypothetical protein
MNMQNVYSIEKSCTRRTGYRAEKKQWEKGNSVKKEVMQWHPEG